MIELAPSRFGDVRGGDDDDDDEWRLRERV